MDDIAVQLPVYDLWLHEEGTLKRILQQELVAYLNAQGIDLRYAPEVTVTCDGEVTFEQHVPMLCANGYPGVAVSYEDVYLITRAAMERLLMYTSETFPQTGFPERPSPKPEDVPDEEAEQYVLQYPNEFRSSFWDCISKSRTAREKRKQDKAKVWIVEQKHEVWLNDGLDALRRHEGVLETLSIAISEQLTRLALATCIESLTPVTEVIIPAEYDRGEVSIRLNGYSVSLWFDRSASQPALVWFKWFEDAGVTHLVRLPNGRTYHRSEEQFVGLEMSFDGDFRIRAVEAQDAICLCPFLLNELEYVAHKST